MMLKMSSLSDIKDFFGEEEDGVGREEGGVEEGGGWTEEGRVEQEEGSELPLPKGGWSIMKEVRVEREERVVGRASGLF